MQHSRKHSGHTYQEPSTVYDLCIPLLKICFRETLKRNGLCTERCTVAFFKGKIIFKNVLQKSTTKLHSYDDISI